MSERSRVRGRNLTKLRRQRQRELRKKIGWVGKKNLLWVCIMLNFFAAQPRCEITNYRVD